MYNTAIINVRNTCIYNVSVCCEDNKIMVIVQQQSQQQRQTHKWYVLETSKYWTKHLSSNLDHSISHNSN